MGDLLACCVGGFLGCVCLGFFLLFFLADFHVLSDTVLSILKLYAAKMILGDPSEFSTSLE